MRDAGSIPRNFEEGLNYRCRMSHQFPGNCKCILNRVHGNQLGGHFDFLIRSSVRGPKRRRSLREVGGGWLSLKIEVRRGGRKVPAGTG